MVSIGKIVIIPENHTKGVGKAAVIQEIALGHIQEVFFEMWRDIDSISLKLCQRSVIQAVNEGSYWRGTYFLTMIKSSILPLDSKSNFRDWRRKATLEDILEIISKISKRQRRICVYAVDQCFNNAVRAIMRKKMISATQNPNNDDKELMRKIVNVEQQIKELLYPVYGDEAQSWVKELNNEMDEIILEENAANELEMRERICVEYGVQQMIRNKLMSECILQCHRDGFNSIVLVGGIHAREIFENLNGIIIDRLEVHFPMLNREDYTETVLFRRIEKSRFTKGLADMAENDIKALYVYMTKSQKNKVKKKFDLNPRFFRSPSL